MAVSRNIYLSFWTDNKVNDDFTPEDKYFFLYLLTNPQTNICGCYEVSFNQMTRQTGYNENTISRLLDRFETEHKMIKYCEETKELLILNWYKYNWNNSSKVISAIEKMAENIKCNEFRQYIYTELNGRKNKQKIKHEECSADNKNNAKQIMTAFGQPNRFPIQKEASYIERWVNDYGFSIPIICEACSRTLLQIGKISFPYANSILSAWKEKNVRTMEDIIALDKTHTSNKEGIQKNNKSIPTKFVNYEQRNWDFSELEQLEAERRKEW